MAFNRGIVVGKMRCVYIANGMISTTALSGTSQIFKHQFSHQRSVYTFHPNDRSIFY